MLFVSKPQYTYCAVGLPLFSDYFTATLYEWPKLSSFIEKVIDFIETFVTVGFSTNDGM